VGFFFNDTSAGLPNATSNDLWDDDDLCLRAINDYEKKINIESGKILKNIYI
jgi:hypothetical protein